MFPPMFEMFWVIFVLGLIFVVVFWIIAIYRAIKGRHGFQGQETSGGHAVIKEREIIREIVKIRCPYCGGLYEETLDKCPHCGAKKP